MPIRDVPVRERKVQLTWEELYGILRKDNKVLDDEEIKGITLMKPKKLLVQVESR